MTLEDAFAHPKLTKPYYIHLMQQGLPKLRPAIDHLLTLIPTNESPTYEEVSSLNMAIFDLIKLASNNNHCGMIRYLDEIEDGTRELLEANYSTDHTSSSLLAELGLAPEPIKRRV